jgi:hypothetical protein
MVHEMKPLVDGRRMCAVVGEKPGPVVGELTARVISYQLGHPDADVAAVEEFLRSLNMDEVRASVPAAHPKKKRKSE